MRRYLVLLGWGGHYISRALNLLRGGSWEETLCRALGRSMNDGGWASLLSWPRWFKEHCTKE
jgi:hypothetical protein